MRRERATALLLASQAFLLLATYYVLKTMREPLVLAHGGAELRSYLAASQVVVLVFVVHGYSWLATRFDRVRLIAASAFVFASVLVVLYAVSATGLPLGVPLYLWVGIFGVVAVTQVWSLASDVLSRAQSLRWLPIIGAGAALGGAVGSFGAAPIARALGTRPLLLVALVPLGAYVAIAWWVHRREQSLGARSRTAVADEGSRNTLRAVLEDRYLLLVAGLALLLSWVNTNGEYVLAQTVLDTSRASGADTASVERAVADFYAGFYGWVNVLGVGLQLIVTGPLLRRFGVGAALVVVPVLALVGYGAMAFVPILALVKVTKIIENAADYSLQASARHMLFLPTSRQARYTSRATIDALVVRAGDVLSGLLVCAGTAIHLGTREFAIINVVLASAWLFVVVAVSRRHAERARLADAE